MSNPNVNTEAAAAAVKLVDVSISDDNVKATVKEFFANNPKFAGAENWSQKVCAYALAYVMRETLGGDEPVSFKTYARFLSQESLHGLSGNASQFKMWFYGKGASKPKVEIDDLVGGDDE